MALWMVTAGYLAYGCYGYDGPVWEWQILGVDYWKGLSAIESCMTGTADNWGGVPSAAVVMGCADARHWLGDDSLSGLRSWRRRHTEVQCTDRSRIGPPIAPPWI